MKDFFLNNWGNLASVAGLIFSFLAFLFSKSASKAAKQARNLAQSRSLAEGLNDIGRSARDLIGDIEKERNEHACERARDLSSNLQYLCARWVKLLPQKSKNNLMKAREQLASIHEVLILYSNNDIASQNRPELIKSAFRVSELISQEYGSAQMASDFVGEQWKPQSWLYFWKK